MKKTVLFINGHLDVGGCEKSLVDVLRNFNYDKYDVDLLLLEHEGDYINEIPKEVHVHLYSLNNSFGPLGCCLKDAISHKDWFSLFFRLNYIFSTKINRVFMKQLGGLFKSLHPEYDIIIAYRPGICTELAAFAFCGKKKISWWHHGEINLSDDQLEQLNAAYEKMNIIVSVSNQIKILLKNAFPSQSHKIHVIPNMINIDELKIKSKILTNQLYEDNKLKIVTVGRMSPEKNMLLCPEIAMILKQKQLDFQWIIVGDGQDKEHVLDKIKEYHLESDLVLVGSKSNPYPYIAKADIMIHPSLVESQGLTIIESMALKTPVIAVNSVGPKEFLKSGENGYLVDPNPAKIANNLIKLINDKELFDFITIRGYETVSMFNVNKIMKRIECILEV